MGDLLYLSLNIDIITYFAEVIYSQVDCGHINLKVKLYRYLLNMH